MHNTPYVLCVYNLKIDHEQNLYFQSRSTFSNPQTVLINILRNLLINDVPFLGAQATWSNFREESAMKENKYLVVIATENYEMQMFYNYEDSTK